MFSFDTKREPEKCQRFQRAGSTKKGLLAPFNPKEVGYTDLKPLSLAALDSSLGEGADEAKPKRKRRATKSAPDYRPDTFARFWAAYPRGEDKQGAIAAWDELKPDDATLQAMSRALVRQKASEEWQRGIGIPYAVRWLRRRRWEDEIKAPAPPPERAGGDLPVWN